jgi:hypothetical protein
VLAQHRFEFLRIWLTPDATLKTGCQVTLTDQAAAEFPATIDVVPQSNA